MSYYPMFIPIRTGSGEGVIEHTGLIEDIFFGILAVALLFSLIVLIKCAVEAARGREWWLFFIMLTTGLLAVAFMLLIINLILL